jgi:hypothetical protein
VCVCGVGVTSLHKVGNNFLAEWCCCVNFWQRVLGMGMKTVFERHTLIVVAETFCVHFSLSFFLAISLPVRRGGGKLNWKDGTTRCCG